MFADEGGWGTRDGAAGGVQDIQADVDGGRQGQELDVKKLKVQDLEVRYELRMAQIKEEVNKVSYSY